MSVREQYVLETAALLHDIGKIGTPDSVLLKPGPLDSEEREVMSHHDMIGAKIIRTTFGNQNLIEIVANHFAWYGGHPMIPSMPTGEDIPLGARILTICDSYDAIITDRVYRKGAPDEDAFKELRRCAGEQFDPRLVELFVDMIIQSKENGPAGVSANVSKRAALQIGLLMDQMTAALEHGNRSEIQAQAEKLSVAATEAKLLEIADMANELREMSGDDSEIEDLLDIAGTLLDLCRLTQRAYMGVGEESRRRREDLARRPFTNKEIG